MISEAAVGSAGSAGAASGAASGAAAGASGAAAGASVFSTEQAVRERTMTTASRRAVSFFIVHSPCFNYF
ncbi:MAG: hypothetical protein E7442_09275 [Ruminococcaceae bacterium]|nr:hypothetical protein [Oscillospiraceae bacterium]